MKIIVLDDSATIQMIIEALLEDMGAKKEEIFLFSNGVKALDFIKKMVLTLYLVILICQ